MRESVPSGSLGHQLILFYRVNGVCTELPLTCDSTGEDGVYTVSCKYVKKKKKKVFLNSTSSCKEFTPISSGFDKLLICWFR